MGGEIPIQSAIEWLLRYYENQGRIVYQKNNSGATVSTYKGKDRFYRFGKKGSPDFYIFGPSGKTLHIEVKAGNGKQNENQIEFEKKVYALGHKYYIVRSVDEVERIIKEEFNGR